ncbi:MAG: PDZ domain-containing protein [Syntrophobacterales bacterium]|nr:PDZ domain-containing protein [Syntrophobacterales bacterium]
MDWAHYFRFSLSDLQGFFSRRTIILTVMAVLLYQTVGVFYQALTLQLLRMTPPPALEIRAPAAVAALREPLGAYNAIPERNIFGTTAETIEEKQAKNKPAPQQDIALLFDLRGTVAGDAKHGFAVIEEKSAHKQRLVKIGDVISGARVLRIKRNALDVLVNDQERTLKMADKTEAPVLPAAGVQPLPASPVAATPGGGMVINRSEISAALADMGSLLRQAQVRPYFKGGVADGFMITNIQPGSMYQRLGIVNGDILLGVDGNRIQTADDMISFLNTLKRAAGATLSLQRGGKPQTLSFQFR